MGYFFAAGTPNPAAVRRVRPVLPSTFVMNARASGLVRARGDDADAVPDRRLCPGGQLDDVDIVLHRRRVGPIHETGVGLTERHFGEHAPHVRLLAYDVRQHGGADAEVAQDLSGVVPDWHALSWR